MGGGVQARLSVECQCQREWSTAYPRRSFSSFHNERTQGAIQDTALKRVD